ncbi:MAG: hypothetical protein LZF60_10050 [Nitrospira sp.]|nr:MAG: hypothetical protein LZF60_10050 [Nitrospira sp.]
MCTAPDFLKVHRHHSIVRLRVWPTMIEETEQALGRLLSEVTEAELTTSLIIVDRSRIRVGTRLK